MSTKAGRMSEKRPEHDYIAARQEKYLTAWRSGDANAIIEFMDKDEFEYLNRGDGDRKRLGHSEVHKTFQSSFGNFHDLKIRTLSLHGHKHFTAWEWEMDYKPALDENGKRQPKDKASPNHMKGCSLMWWNNKDKITKQHDYGLIWG